jgi:hypothetical protein
MAYDFLLFALKEMESVRNSASLTWVLGRVSLNGLGKKLLHGLL